MFFPYFVFKFLYFHEVENLVTVLEILVQHVVETSAVVVVGNLLPKFSVEHDGVIYLWTDRPVESASTTSLALSSRASAPA
jgi:hypothetical protein